MHVIGRSRVARSGSREDDRVAVVHIVLGETVDEHLGEPIDVSRYGSADSGRARRQATDEIMAAIHALTGQELAGVYNESPPATAVERVKRALRPERR